jgi:hypothetical protein
MKPELLNGENRKK